MMCSEDSSSLIPLFFSPYTTGRRRRGHKRRRPLHSPTEKIPGRPPRPRDNHGEDGTAADHEGQLQPLHAEGDIRATGVGGQHHEGARQLQKSRKSNRYYG